MSVSVSVYMRVFIGLSRETGNLLFDLLSFVVVVEIKSFESHGRHVLLCRLSHGVESNIFLMAPIPWRALGSLTMHACFLFEL